MVADAEVTVYSVNTIEVPDPDDSIDTGDVLSFTAYLYDTGTSTYTTTLESFMTFDTVNGILTVQPEDNSNADTYYMKFRVTDDNSVGGVSERYIDTNVF